MYQLWILGFILSVVIAGCSAQNKTEPQTVEQGFTGETEIIVTVTSGTPFTDHTVEPTRIPIGQPPYPENQQNRILEFKLVNQDEEVTDQPEYEIYGVAPVETVISINDDIVVVGNDEKFSKWVTLEEGPNLIEIVASDLTGNETDILLTIYYVP